MSELTEEDKVYISKLVEINPSEEEEMKASASDTDLALAKYKEVIGTYYPDKIITSTKTGQYYDYDYRIFASGVLIRHLEVKVRRNQFNDFPTTMIPLRKHAVAVYHFNKSKIKTSFCAAFS